LFANIGRNYRNADANVIVFLYVVASYEDRDNWKDPVFNWNCTGLELHKFASSVKKELLMILNENAEEYRKTISLPADYWRLAVRVIVNNLNSKRGEIAPEQYHLTRDCLCLVTEAATEEFRDGDSIGIVITTQGDTWVEILSKDVFGMTRKCLGNVQKSHGPRHGGIAK